MTAPARPQPRTDRPATREQLLVLADRAERGPLTPAEAARLREGIALMYADRRSFGGRVANQTRHRREAVRQLLAVQALVRSARQRGVRTVPVQILAAVVRGPVEMGPSEAAGASLAAERRSRAVGAVRA